METAIVYWGSIGILEKRNGNCYRILGFYWDNGKEKSKLLSYVGGSIGIMEKNMETTTVYWCSIGIMEKKNRNCYRILGDILG